MPAHTTVTLQTLIGDTHLIRLSKNATCADLRLAAQRCCGVSRKRIVLCKGGEILEDDTPVIDTVGGCAISDLIDPCVSLELEVQVDMITVTKACEVCSDDARKYCGKCKVARYCSEACQRQAWASHKLVCSTRP